jgi:hypothetical protein
MTIGQYLASFVVLGCLVVLALMLAARWGGLALASAGVLIALATAAFFLWRSGGRTGPEPQRSAIIALAAIATAALVVYLRRHARGTPRQLVTGLLAWLGLVFAWFETAYLLRS